VAYIWILSALLVLLLAGITIVAGPHGTRWLILVLVIAAPILWWTFHLPDLTGDNAEGREALVFIWGGFLLGIILGAIGHQAISAPSNGDES
jgi:hypothetical protein